MNFSLIAQKKQKKDTLSKYKSLELEFWDYYNSDDILNAKKRAYLYLYSAKKEKRSASYYVYGHLLIQRCVDNRDALKHLDSAILYSKKLKKWGIGWYPALLYIKKGKIYYDNRNFKEAIKNHLIALEYAEKDNNHFLISTIYQELGLIYLQETNQNEKALSFFNKSESYYKNDSLIKGNSENYLWLLRSKSNSFLGLKKLDSSEYYITKGLQLSKIYNLDDMTSYFKLSEGILEFYKNNFEKSKYLLSEVYSDIEKLDDIENLTELNYYLAESLKLLKETDASVKHFKLMDSLLGVKSQYSKEIRYGMESLISYYNNIGDLKNELKYTKKLMVLDNNYVNDYKIIVNEFDIKYDKNKLLKKQKKLTKKLKSVNSQLKKNNILFIIISFSLVLILGYYIRRFLIFKKRVKTLLEKNSENKSENLKNKLKDVPTNVEKEVLSKLKEFEERKGFLDSSITINSLAKELKTNSRYLSKIINYYKGSSVVNYLNSLRVDYAVERLKKDTKFRNYTIENIALESGFNNPRPFNNAFIKFTKIKATSFIRELKK